MAFNPGLTYLKVKLKSLSEEAKIIRKEEVKAALRARNAISEERRNSSLEVHSGLHAHRAGTVKPEARATSLAYGFLRGRSYDQVEGATIRPVPRYIKNRAAKMVGKYGNFETVKEVVVVAKQFEQWFGETN